MGSKTARNLFEKNIFLAVLLEPCLAVKEGSKTEGHLLVHFWSKLIIYCCFTPAALNQQLIRAKKQGYFEYLFFARVALARRPWREKQRNLLIYLL